MHKGIKSRENPGNACYHSVQNVSCAVSDLQETTNILNEHAPVSMNRHYLAQSVHCPCVLFDTKHKTISTTDMAPLSSIPVSGTGTLQKLAMTLYVAMMNVSQS